MRIWDMITGKDTGLETSDLIPPYDEQDEIEDETPEAPAAPTLPDDVQDDGGDDF